MSNGLVADRFHQDPLLFLDRELAAAAEVVVTGRNEYSLANPDDARAVLRNHDGHYREHSDFFHTRHGVLQPREEQLRMRRESRAFLRRFLDERAAELPAFLTAQLPLASEWPDTGNRLAYHFLLPALLSPDSPPKLRRLLDEIVERAVLANARARQPRWRRMLLQFKTTLLLSGAIESRQKLAAREPIDLLDVVARTAQPGRSDELAEVFLSFVFAAAGSVGFVLAWSIYLMGTHPEREAPPEWVVQEALRLWPVAWQLGRHPTREHTVSGIAVGADDEVVVCPYLVHRNPRHWQEPAEFRPGRWADPQAWRNPAFIPFGHGPHRCIAADLSVRLVSDMLRIITDANTLAVTVRDPRPNVAAAMAPPYFELKLHPRNPADRMAAAATEHQGIADHPSVTLA